MLIAGIERSFAACPRSPMRFGFASFWAHKTLPSKARIDSFPLDRDQGQLNACVEFSIAEVYEYLLGERYSALFGYYFARRHGGDRPTDNVGLSIPESIMFASVQGLCRASVWPDNLDAWIIPPTPLAILDAEQHVVTKKAAVADLPHTKALIASKQPVTLGFDVPDTIASVDTIQTGVVTFPPGANIIGRHCVNAIAYDDDRGLLGCTSHYGKQFGDGGLIWLPYSAWDQHVADAMAIRSVS